MLFFDSNCFIGMRSIIAKGSFYDVGTLVKKMEFCNIEKAMVYSSLAEEYHPMVGNEQILKDIKNYKCQLYPVWVVMPEITNEFLEPSILLRKMMLNNVKMVRMFPGKLSHNYIFSPISCGNLFNILESHKIPLMIGIDQTDYEYIYNVASKYKNIPIILTNVGYRSDRILYPLLEKYNNIYIETSSYKVNFGIEAICKYIGAKRLIFGSGLPVYSAGSAIAMITYSALKYEEKELIAKGNIVNILEAVDYE